MQLQNIKIYNMPYGKKSPLTKKVMKKKKTKKTKTKKTKK
tara:strand:- start:527 stop:646 length:120 start_codon:yes stop_codon:yes gene_type:complete